MRTLEGTPAIQPQDKAILSECRDILQRILPGATVYLYGSGARGACEPDSDLDLLILTEHRLSREEEDLAAHAVYHIELARGVVTSTLFYSREKRDAPLNRATPFRNRVEAEAVPL
jgi:predicted nucleotidyltransferase